MPKPGCFPNDVVHGYQELPRITPTPEAHLADLIERAFAVIISSHPPDDGDALSDKDRAVIVNALRAIGRD